MKKLFLLLLIIILSTNVFAISMTRDMPDSVDAPFTLTYTVTGATSQDAGFVNDTVTGGCTFPDGTTNYKSLLFLDLGMSKSITINVPNGATTCSFTGNYQITGMASEAVLATDSIIVNSNSATTTTIPAVTTTTLSTTTTTLNIGPDPDTCQFWEKRDMTTGKCVTEMMWIYIAIGAVVLLLVLKK